MDDKHIIELYFARDEQAISETEKKYGALCRYIASSVLAVNEDVEECVSDIMLALWNAIPPDRPEDLRAYVGKAIRNRAHEMIRDANAWKRGGRVQIVSEELLSTIPDDCDLAADFEAKRAGMIISRVLDSLSKTDRKIFVLRYWMGLGYSQIVAQTGAGDSRVKMSLHRTRKRIAEELKKEGITV